MMEPDNAYSIRAAQRVCDILDLLQERPDGVPLAHVAEVTGLPKSSAFRYLATLESRRYVERDPASGDFRLGLAFLPLQARRLDLLAQRARPHLEALRDRFEETINLGLLDGTRVIYLDIVESPKSMRLAARPGDRDHVHSTALGKAIAAELPEERVKTILASSGMPTLTASTITDEARFFDELARVRRQGYAVDNGENEPDGRCVGVPIPGGQLPAALSFSAPVSRFPIGQVEEVAAALKEVAGALVDDFGPTQRDAVGEAHAAQSGSAVGPDGRSARSIAEADAAQSGSAVGPDGRSARSIAEADAAQSGSAVGPSVGREEGDGSVHAS